VGIEAVTREVEVRAVRCDVVSPTPEGLWVASCSAVTTEFLPGIDEPQGGPVLLDATWLQLRTGGIKQWFFCSHAHLADWVTGAGAQVLNPGVQSLTTVRARSET
jgi:hypothetical protein